jgi:hypothetical protein
MHIFMIVPLSKQFFIDVAHFKARKTIRPDIMDGILIENGRKTSVLDHFSDCSAIFQAAIERP